MVMKKNMLALAFLSVGVWAAPSWAHDDYAVEDPSDVAVTAHREPRFLCKGGTITRPLS
jgi:hypothetical protein